PADTGSGLLQRAGTNDGGGIIEAEIHLAKRPKLFRQTEPPLLKVFHASSSELVECAIAQNTSGTLPKRRSISFIVFLMLGGTKVASSKRVFFHIASGSSIGLKGSLTNLIIRLDPVVQRPFHFVPTRQRYHCFSWSKALLGCFDGRNLRELGTILIAHYPIIRK
ncbi:MAG: hypothetical protein WC048_20565, partial [Rhizobium sp.]